MAPGTFPRQAITRWEEQVHVDLRGPIKVVGDRWFALTRCSAGALVQPAAAGEDQEPWRWGRGRLLRLTWWHAFSWGRWAPTDGDVPGYMADETPHVPLYDELAAEAEVIDQWGWNEKPGRPVAVSAS